MKIVDMDELRAADAAWKPARLNETAVALAALWTDQSSNITVNYLRELGLGNRLNTRHPFQAAMTRRIVEALSVVYTVPAVRRLWTPGGTEFADDSLGMVDATDAFEKSAYDLLWQRIDALRNLYRTVLVEWVEDEAESAVSAYVFPPHLVTRSPSPVAPANIELDSAIALQIRVGVHPRDNLYRVWTRDYDGTRRVFIVGESGEMEGEQPYGVSGLSPYGAVLPLHLVHDEHPLGEPWLPVPESRVAWALGVNGAVNDLAWLVQMEAHSTRVFKDPDSAEGAAPTETGPDATVVVRSRDGDFKIAATSPKIAESAKTLDQLLRLWALSEYLPGDAFTETTTHLTGVALKVKERDLSARRQRQLGLVNRQEQAAWVRYAAVHNLSAARWGMAWLEADARMRVTPGRSWQPVDLKELQDVLYKDLATGFISRIDYRMERFGETRTEAERALERVRSDNAEFPLTEFQNPAALSDVKSAALTEVAPTEKAPGAFNPDTASSVDGASVVDAAKRATATPP